MDQTTSWRGEFSAHPSCISITKISDSTKRYSNWCPFIIKALHSVSPCMQVYLAVVDHLLPLDLRLGREAEPSPAAAAGRRVVEQRLRVEAGVLLLRHLQTSFIFDQCWLTTVPSWFVSVKDQATNRKFQLQNFTEQLRCTTWNKRAQKGGSLRSRLLGKINRAKGQKIYFCLRQEGYSIEHVKLEIRMVNTV